MTTVILVIHLMITIALVGVIMVQRSEGGALGIGGGGGGGFMSARGAANLLTRMTAILAAGFFATSILLAIRTSWEARSSTEIGASPTTERRSDPSNSDGTPNKLGPVAPTAPAGSAPAPSGPQLPDTK
jgi:preprotein translocase subunit SecG